MYFLLCTLLAESIELTQSPASNQSPSRMIHSTTSGFHLDSKLYIFGGQESDGSTSSSLYSFDISSNTWKEVNHLGAFKPPGLYNCKSFISRNTQFYVLYGKNEFGISENVYVFNLNSLLWSLSYLKGDKISHSILHAECSFQIKSVEYLALYGGISKDGITDSFYM